jgi:hypothetical protein
MSQIPILWVRTLQDLQLIRKQGVGDGNYGTPLRWRKIIQTGIFFEVILFGQKMDTYSKKREEYG